jgi:hypothetical protein
MADLDFSNEEILEQARGDSAAIWHLAARWARERDGSVDGWASFVGREFAPTWDSMGTTRPPSMRAAGRLIAGRLTCGRRLTVTPPRRPVRGGAGSRVPG